VKSVRNSRGLDHQSDPPFAAQLRFVSALVLHGQRSLLGRSSWLALIWVLVATFGFARYARHTQPLAEWSSFFWARAWLAALLFVVSSLSIGLKSLALLRVHAWSSLERFSVAMALGVLTFALGIFLAGLAGVLDRPFFFLWPALLLSLGARALIRHCRWFLRQLTRFGSSLILPQSAVQALAALLVVAGACGLYAQVITPNNIGFDARWYHLPMAEGYAAIGRIRPFPEGWYLGAYPQLASWLYTWAFLAPGTLKHHLCLAAHLEFVIFLLTVGGVSALGARLIHGERLRYAGAALFLFPSLFVYDSNLNCGADHVLAFWAAPLGLVLLRYLKLGDARNGALVGLVLGGAILTKYQAVYFAVPISILLGLNLLRDRRLTPVFTAAAAALLVTSPHWLKNWIAYGDPLYPNLYRWLPDRPFFRDASVWFPQNYWFSGSTEPRTPPQKLVDTIRTLFAFSFSPLGWGRLPDPPTVIGSLFTLLLPLVLWVRPRWRVLVIVGCAHAALAVWYLTYPYDRYLQAFLPWMAACLAAILAAAWRLRAALLRFALLLIVALQLVWGGDAYFLRSHAMLKDLPLHALGSADGGKTPARFPYPGEELADIGGGMAKGSKIVGHDFYQSVGAGVQAICDQPAWQGRIDYLQLDNPEAVLHTWRALGATHLVWPFAKEARAPDDLARDAVFARASVAFTSSFVTVAGYRVAALEHRTPSPALRDATQIAWLACGGDRELAAYTPAGLSSGTPESTFSEQAIKQAPDSALAPINAVWLKPHCAEAKAAQSVLSTEFTEVMRSGELVLWIRTQSVPPAT